MRESDDDREQGSPPVAGVAEMNLNGEASDLPMDNEKLSILLAEFEAQDVLVTRRDSETHLPQWYLTNRFVEHLMVETEKVFSENNDLCFEDSMRVAAIRTLLRFYAGSPSLRDGLSSKFQLLSLFIEKCFEDCGPKLATASIHGGRDDER